MHEGETDILEEYSSVFGDRLNIKSQEGDSLKKILSLNLEDKENGKTLGNNKKKKKPRESYSYGADSTHCILLRLERKVKNFRAAEELVSGFRNFVNSLRLYMASSKKRFHYFQKSLTPPKKLRTAALELLDKEQGM